jgi:hypothetical protein
VGQREREGEKLKVTEEGEEEKGEGGNSQRRKMK